MSLTCFSVGAITKSERKIDIPTSTWVGGVVGVPSALRTKPSTIRIRVNPVSMRSAPGSTASSVSSRKIWTGAEIALPPPTRLIVFAWSARSGSAFTGRSSA